MISDPWNLLRFKGKSKQPANHPVAQMERWSIDDKVPALRFSVPTKTHILWKLMVVRPKLALRYLFTLYRSCNFCKKYHQNLRLFVYFLLTKLIWVLSLFISGLVKSLVSSFQSAVYQQNVNLPFYAWDIQHCNGRPCSHLKTRECKSFVTKINKSGLMLQIRGEKKCY